MSPLDALTPEEIDAIAEAVVAKLKPILEKISSGAGFIRDIGPIVEEERVQQAKESVNTITGFDMSFYE